MKGFSILLIFIIFLCSSWGFNTHKKINQAAVFLLPTELASFYKLHIKRITEKVIDADKSCYVDTAEGPKHYIDLDRYEEVDSIPYIGVKQKKKYPNEN